MRAHSSSASQSERKKQNQSVNMRYLSLVVLLFFVLLGFAYSGNAQAERTDQQDERNEDTTNEGPVGNQNSSRSQYWGRSGSEEDLTDEYKKVLRSKQAEARRLKQQRERRKLGNEAAKRIIEASKDDNCDWKQQPLAAIRGEQCGVHYKVLGINRKQDSTDKPTIKKAYRQVSLAVHPDKNPADGADEAFKIVQDAYECLQDEDCKRSYDQQLAMKEEAIMWQRVAFKEKLMDKTINILNYVHFHISVAAHYVYGLGMKVWDVAGEWQIDFFDDEWPLGRPLLLLLLLWKGKVLLTIHMIAYAIERINFEIARNRGIF